MIVLGTDEGKAERLRQTAQGKELSVELLDLRDSAAVKAFCGMQSDVHVLINCAGIARPNEEWDEPTFLDVLDVNLAGYMRLTYGLINSLINSKGCIINIASMLSFLGDAYVPAYSAAKSGILGFTRSLAHKLGPHGVRVNAIAPGYILTDMTSSLILDVRGEAAISRRTALGRVGATQDLVGAATFLCSPELNTSPGCACLWTVATFRVIHYYKPRSIAADVVKVARSRWIRSIARLNSLKLCSFRDPQCPDLL